MNLPLNWVKQRLGGGLSGSAREDVPFATDQSLADFVGNLPASQPPAALEMIADALADLERSALSAPRRAQVTVALDEAAQSHLRATWHMLFPAVGEERLSPPSAKALEEFLPVAARALTQLAIAPADAAAKAEVRVSAAILAARAMQAWLAMGLMQRVFGRAPDTAFWESVHRLLRHAEELKLVRTALFVYPQKGLPKVAGKVVGKLAGKGSEKPALDEGVAKQTTSYDLYTRLMALECAPLENFLPTQINALACLLDEHAAALPLAGKPGGTAPYFTQIREAAGPQRYSGTEHVSGMRYLDMARLAVTLGEMRKTALTTAEIPEGLLGSDVTHEGFLRLAALLLKHWSVTPPKRRHARSVKASQLMIVGGFVQTRRMIAAAEYAFQEVRRDEKEFGEGIYDQTKFEAERLFHSVDGESEARTQERRALLAHKIRKPLEILHQIETKGDKQMMERWNVADISERGFGATPASGGRWAKVGAIIGFRQPELPRWNAAIVRRVARKNGAMAIGVEVMRGLAGLARVRPLKAEEEAKWQDLPQMGDGYSEAILIEGQGAHLVLEGSKFSADTRCLLVIGAKKSLVRLIALEESGPDYSVGTFERLS